MSAGEPFASLCFLNLPLPSAFRLLPLLRSVLFAALPIRALIRARSHGRPALSTAP